MIFDILKLEETIVFVEVKSGDAWEMCMMIEDTNGPCLGHYLGFENCMVFIKR